MTKREFLDKLEALSKESGWYVTGCKAVMECHCSITIEPIPDRFNDFAETMAALRQLADLDDR